MSLLDRPTPPQLLTVDAPFLLTARWWVPGSRNAGDGHPTLYIAAAEYPGAWPHEYAVGMPLALPVAQVEPDELPVALALRHSADRGWHFDYLGGAEYFAVDQQAPAIPVVAPTPMTPDQLSHQAEAMLRDSLGLGPDDPLPAPAGPLPPAEQPEEPYRFDPFPHMDLSRAEPPPAFHGEAPATAPPGPPPAPNARTAPVPQLPPPAPPGPPPDPNAEPFVH